ncbi:MAG: hypothetical protein WA125_01675, partial [Desulfosporosinus sp.]
RYTEKDIERNIFMNPFKRFEDMRFISRCRDIEDVEFNRHVWKKLTLEEKAWIIGRCEEEVGGVLQEDNTNSLVKSSN